MLKQQIKGEVNSWAIRWYASAFIQNKLTLYPGTSLVSNIGFDGTGTHCGEIQEFTAVLLNKPIELQKIETKENIKAYKAFVRFFMYDRYNKLKKKIKQIFSI
jgi:hypothetical protein